MVKKNSQNEKTRKTNQLKNVKNKKKKNYAKLGQILCFLCWKVSALFVKMLILFMFFKIVNNSLHCGMNL